MNWRESKVRVRKSWIVSIESIRRHFIRMILILRQIRITITIRVRYWEVLIMRMKTQRKRIRREGSVSQLQSKTVNLLMKKYRNMKWYLKR